MENLQVFPKTLPSPSTPNTPLAHIYMYQPPPSLKYACPPPLLKLGTKDLATQSKCCRKRALNPVPQLCYTTDLQNLQL
jgi:hypothetical protein